MTDCLGLGQEYHKAMESYQRGLAIDESDTLCRQGLQKVMNAINTSGGDGDVERERPAHAMADPEIQAILSDPIIRNIISQLQTNPAEGQKVSSFLCRRAGFNRIHINLFRHFETRILPGNSRNWSRPEYCK